MAAHRRLDRNRETAVIFTRSDFVAVACFRHRRGDQRTSCRMRSTFFDSVDFFIEAFNSVSHLSQISVWAKALQVRRINRAVVPLAIHLAFDLSRDRFSVFIVRIESSHARYDAPLWLAFAVQKLPLSRAGNNHRRQSQGSRLVYRITKADNFGLWPHIVRRGRSTNMLGGCRKCDYGTPNAIHQNHSFILD